MARYDASLLTQEEYRRAKAAADAVVTGMCANSTAVYSSALSWAASKGPEIGERAVAGAVRRMAEQGVYASTYRRSDGTLVRVPADVGIRRAVHDQAKATANSDTLELCAEYGTDLVEVNETANCRDTHRVINGKVFSLSGADKRHPKLTGALESLFHDPNCGHTMRIYREGMGRRYRDPLEGTGYTPDEARAAITAQRRMENGIRKRKRAIEALEAAGADARPDRARLRAQQRRLRDHIAANEPVCRRERHRERLYDAARRIAAALREGYSGRSEADRYAVAPKALNGKRMRGIVRRAVGDTGAVRQMGEDAVRILEKTGGTAFEELYVYDLDEGERIARDIDQRARRQVAPSGKTRKAIAEAVGRGHRVAMMHNHPGSSLPSMADIDSIAKTGASVGVIVCHDGSLYSYRIVKAPAQGYIIDNSEQAALAFIRFVSKRENKGDGAMLEAVEQMYGVRIERFS